MVLVIDFQVLGVYDFKLDCLKPYLLSFRLEW